MKLPAVKKPNQPLTRFDKILKFLLDKTSRVKLTKNQLEQLKRYEAAFSFLLEWKSKETVVKLLMEQFEVSRATAYNDVNEAISLFGDVNKTSKEGLRHLMTEYLMQGLAFAKEAKDPYAIEKIASAIAKINRLGEEDAKGFDPTSIILPAIVFTSDPEVLKQRAITEDVDHEEIG